MEFLWQTAREVGGDFYDVFFLADGRVGFLIADVADKGMPAALFMTMVRTLIRGTVQDIESPSEVLARVNDALIPDTQSGMFITLFYGVLSLDTGQLIYANAGHNPPYLWKKDSDELFPLVRGGMALGVLEGIIVAEQMVYINPGDCLVTYTDGVTEAFSVNEEFFGDDRLRQEILSAAKTFGSSDQTEESSLAKTMIEAIDTAVAHFIGYAPRSDDLTLLALSRL
jgi:sigma-B regulation protein RsbU (phosphoserine phosphatase)